MIRERIQGSWWGRILAEHDTEPIELIGGITKVLMGCWLLLPWDTFASSAAFSVLAVLREQLWGALLILIGAAHLAALYNGHRAWRGWAALIGFLIWFAFACVFVVTNPPGVGWIMFLSVAFAQMWASIRLGLRA